jgi:hypothetical protein
MTSIILSWAVLGLLMVTSLGLLLSRDWRWSLGFLAAQYVGMFWMVSLHWPFGLASIKLVTGWMATAALGVTRIDLSGDDQADVSSFSQGRFFRIFIAGIVLLLVIAATPGLESIIPGIERPVIAGGLLLMGMGLLQLGLSSSIMKITLGLLTIMAGFETLYAAMETSLLLAGLLSIINLGLALAGAYLLTSAPQEEVE